MEAPSPSESVDPFRADVALLAQLIKGDHDAFAGVLGNDPERQARFAGLVAAHGLQPFVFSQLSRSPVRAALPRWWLDQLKAAYFTRWAEQERLVHGLVELCSIFEGRHELILLKGPYHALRFYGGMNRRQFADLDILIRRRDLPSVEKLLLENGYARKSNVVLTRGLTARFTHALDFVKPPHIAVDLHWSLSANAAHSIDYDAIWRERQTFVVRDRTFFVLADEHEIVFSLISIFKDLERGAARLRTFVDLYFMLLALHDGVDWRRFLEHRRPERLLGVSVSVLALFLDLFACADRFPALARAVASEHALLEGSLAEPADLLNAPEGALRNKLWAARYYECSRLHLFLWWLVSLPFRLAVHAPGRYTRLVGATQK